MVFAYSNNLRRGRSNLVPRASLSRGKEVVVDQEQIEIRYLTAINHTGSPSRWEKSNTMKNNFTFWQKSLWRVRKAIKIIKMSGLITLKIIVKSKLSRLLIGKVNVLLVHLHSCDAWQLDDIT